MAGTLLIVAVPVTAGDVFELDPVTVTAPRMEVALPDYPAAVTAVGREPFAEGRGLALDQGLDRVPGLYSQNRYNQAQDLRLSLRGFGVRAPFGVRGLRAFVDGVPYTAVDGQSQLDAVDPYFVERMEVIRGPSSALYGNAAGGVIALTTLEPPPFGDELGAQILFGSYGERAQRVWGGTVEGRWRNSVTASNVEIDGYRDHSEAARRRLGVKVDRDLQGGESLRLIATFLDAPFTQDPGSLSRDEVEEDRRQANPRNVEFDAGEELEQQTGALLWRAEPNASELWEARAFVQRRDFENRLPFEGNGAVAFERYFAGVGGRHEGRGQWAGRPVHYTVGTDAEWQRDDRQRYDNDFGERGARTEDQLEQARAVGAYSQAEWEGAPGWRLLGGARIDWLRLTVDDRFDHPDPGDDFSDRHQFAETSYLAGSSYAYHPDHRIYVNAATSFEAPTLRELHNPAEGAGGFNPELDPQQARSVELGFKGGTGLRWRYDIALFDVRVEDEIVPFEKDGVTYYRNAAETRRRGVELGLEGRPVDRLKVTAAVAYGRFTFRDHVAPEEPGVAGDEQVRGNRIPGVPRAHGYLEVAWEARGGWRWSVDARAAEGVWADDRNTVRSPGYTEVGVRATRSFVTAAWEARPFIGINNLFDEEYDANVRINAGPDDSLLEERRYFEPAPERTVYAGVTFYTR